MSCEFGSPIVIVLDWVAVNSFVRAAVHAEVYLSISIEIERPQDDAAFNGLLVDRCGYAFPVPHKFPRQSTVNRDEFHINPQV
jgi:hypothetical protein